MPADIYVTRIVLKKDLLKGQINYIQFFYSNGSPSPVFQTMKGNKENEQLVELDEIRRPIKKVKQDHAENQVTSVSFYDASDNKVGNYYESHQECFGSVTYEICANEQLIGFYGFYGS